MCSAIGIFTALPTPIHVAGGKFRHLPYRRHFLTKISPPEILPSSCTPCWTRWLGATGCSIASKKQQHTQQGSTTWREWRVCRGSAVPAHGPQLTTPEPPGMPPSSTHRCPRKPGGPSPADKPGHGKAAQWCSVPLLRNCPAPQVAKPIALCQRGGPHLRHCPARPSPSRACETAPSPVTCGVVH